MMRRWKRARSMTGWRRGRILGWWSRRRQRGERLEGRDEGSQMGNGHIDGAGHEKAIRKGAFTSEFINVSYTPHAVRVPWQEQKVLSRCSLGPHPGHLKGTSEQSKVQSTSLSRRPISWVGTALKGRRWTISGLRWRAGTFKGGLALKILTLIRFIRYTRSL